MKKMKKLTFSLALLAFALILNGCGTQKTVAIKPELGVAKKSTIPLSTINLPISINCLSLENNINKQFAGVLYNDESFENNNNDNDNNNVNNNNDNNNNNVAFPASLPGPSPPLRRLTNHWTTRYLMSCAGLASL